MSYQEQTPSGIPVRAVYGPEDRLADEPVPGPFPFTRSNFKTGYRGRLWAYRQYSWFGTAEESHQRYRYLLGQGATGLSVALDLPTQCGDSDDPEVTEAPSTRSRTPRSYCANAYCTVGDTVAALEDD
jgi:methylmalonyl-CoA mutase N-terminal domain/subunit